MSDEEQTEGPLGVHISVIGPHETGGTIRIDDPQGSGMTITVDTRTMRLIQLTGTTVSWDAVSAILTLGAVLQKGASDGGVDLIADNRSKLRDVYRTLYHAAHLVTRETALEASYELLREGKISRAKAAVLASDVLRKEIKTDTWRKAVDKWAADNSRPPVELPRGRPGKRNSEDSL